MAYVTTIDISGLTADEYRRILDHMGVEDRPADGIYFHLAAPTDDGFRITEIWDSSDGFHAFIDTMLFPAAEALGIRRAAAIKVEPLHNIFVPRAGELARLADGAPGGRKRR